MYKVSIVIPTTRPQLLLEALDSVSKQNFKDAEVVIIEDKERNGIAKTLNMGVKQAKGKYIAILADDDIWITKSKLKEQVKFLDTHIDHILVGTSSIVVDANTNTEISRFMNPNVFPPHSSIMYRRCAGEYDETLKRAIDLDFYLTASKLGKFGFLPDIWIKYKENTNGDILSTRKTDSYWICQVLKKHKKSCLKAMLRYYLFSFLKVVPQPYNLYRKIRYEL